MLVILIVALIWIMCGALVAAFVVAAALEIVGIGVVVWDVKSDRQQATALLSYRRPRITTPRAPRPDPFAGFGRTVGGESRARRQREGHDRQIERAFSAVVRESERADQVILDALADLLRGSITRRLTGPILITAGLIIGTGANVAAL